MQSIECSFNMNNIKAVFENKFSPWNITFSDIYHKEGNTYIIKKNGWNIHFFIDNDNRFFEFYCSHSASSDLHIRISEDGKIQNLEALKEFNIYFNTAAGAAKEEECKKNNEHILKNLKKFGLYDLEIFIYISQDENRDFSILESEDLENWNSTERNKLIEYMKKNELNFKPNIYVIYPSFTLEDALEVFEFEKIQ